MCTSTDQWRRPVVKCGGQGQPGQAIKLFQVLKNVVLPSIFDTSILDDVKVAELSNNSFEWKNVTLLGDGGQNIFWPSYIFSGGQDQWYISYEIHFSYSLS